MAGGEKKKHRHRRRSRSPSPEHLNKRRSRSRSPRRMRYDHSTSPERFPRSKPDRESNVKKAPVEGDERKQKK